MNLYYKVEAAFDVMADALKAAMNVADNSEETELYSDLADDLADLRDDTQSLYEKLIQKKNAAPAAGTAETAKESDKHSDLSIDKILENVKGSFLLAEQNPDGGVDVTANIKLGDDLIAVYGAVVSVIYYMAQKQKLSTDKLTEIENKARNHAIRRVLKVSTAIVRKLNPNCGFVLIDKLEQMDAETLQDFGTWLEQEGLQAIATRVSTGGECSIIIEDGTWEKAYAGNPRTAGVAG